MDGERKAPNATIPCMSGPGISEDPSNAKLQSLSGMLSYQSTCVDYEYHGMIAIRKVESRNREACIHFDKAISYIEYICPYHASRVLFTFVSIVLISLSLICSSHRQQNEFCDHPRALKPMNRFCQPTVQYALSFQVCLRKMSRTP